MGFLINLHLQISVIKINLQATRFNITILIRSTFCFISKSKEEIMNMTLYYPLTYIHVTMCSIHIKTRTKTVKLSHCYLSVKKRKLRTLTKRRILTSKHITKHMQTNLFMHSVYIAGLTATVGKLFFIFFLQNKQFQLCHFLSLTIFLTSLKLNIN